MKKQLLMDINVGLGDHLFVRMFMDGIKDQYDRIAITHSRPAMRFWHHDNQARWDFNLKLASAVFGEPPYVLVPNAHFPFFPVERLVKEVNNKPVKPNLDCLCVGKSIGLKYIVITTKARQFPKIIFDQIKDKITASLQKLASEHTIVILGEREVEKTIEYNAEVNRHQVFGLYDYLINILPPNKVVDLTVPALGVATSAFSQFQQDCLIMKEADAVVSLGTGGNIWMAACMAKQSVVLRADTELDRLGITEYPDVSLTKDVDQFTNFLAQL